jgi:hypothetical protein
MFKYFKGEPNSYVIQYKNGRVKRHGKGLDFWYLAFNTSISALRVGSLDAPFIFNESTINFQQVAIQGQITFRVDEPLKTAQKLDFDLDLTSQQYKHKGPEKLRQRIINAVQAATRRAINVLELEQALTQVKQIARSVLEQIRQDEGLLQLGVVIESLYFTAISATPEMQKALEAEYRESLQQQADKAIYDRRAAALEEERRIRQREMETDIDLENQRKQLVEMQADNSIKLAEAEAKADEMKLDPYGKLPPQALIGLALKEFAGNAGNIGSLNITPDMLGQIIQWVGQPGSAQRQAS